MRIGGLASGMDTESMVQELMKAHRIPLDKITQKKQYTEWQRDDYRTVNRNLNDFRNSTNDSMLRLSTFIKKTVSSSAPEEVSIKNINSVSDFSGTLSVQQLATQATMRSDGKVGGGTSSIDASVNLSTLDPTLTNPQTIIIKAIKEDGTLQTDEEAFTYTFDPTKTSLQNVMNEINSKSNVTAFYDQQTGKISMTAKYSGNNAEGNEIEISSTDATTSAFNTFTKLDSNNKVAADKNIGTEGINSEFTLNGLATNRSSNIFTINGFEFNLKQVTTKDITFSSTPDVDSILESVTKFVDDYNKLIENLNGQIRETKYRDYQPLTDEEKEALSEDQIKKWEEKAMSGTLKNDSIISGVLNQMRTAMSSVVGGVSGANALSKLGITTSSNYLENGKLTIDETKLREAISADPNQVYELFAADGDTDSEKGIARRLTEALDDARTKITTKAGSGTATVNNTFVLGRLLDGYEDQMTRFEERLESLENRYWKQFTAMEQAIQKANSQSTYLSGMFSTGS